MVTTRRERNAAKIKLAQPDRSGPTEETLLDFAKDRDLFDQADKRQKQLRKRNKGRDSDNETESDDTSDDDDDEGDEGEGLSPTAEKVLDVLLWSVSLSMLHFTFDILAQHQYAIDISWHNALVRFLGAVVVFYPLIYVFHPYPKSTVIIPFVPRPLQHPLRQTLFFVASIYSGCYLIYITNEFGYYKVIKRSPGLGCIWLWSIMELDLIWAAISLVGTGGYYWGNGYSWTDIAR